VTGPGAGPDRDLLEDYRALRHGLGAYRPAQDVLSVAGADAAGYLQGQCSQDLAGLGVGDAADSLLLEPDGKLCALVRVVRVAGDGFLVAVDGGFGEAVAARLARFRLRAAVAIEPLGWPCVALRGPGAAAATQPEAAGPAAGGAGPPYRIAVSWNGTEGVDLLGPGAEDAVPPGARWCGEPAWEALRVEAGIPAMGRELDGRTIAAEADLVARTVSLTKGCYTGQELVARLDARGNRVARRLAGVVVAGRTGGPGPGPSLLGAELAVAGREAPAGTVTSAAWSPGLGTAVGLAYVHRSVAVPGPATAAVGNGGGPSRGAVEVELRTLPLFPERDGDPRSVGDRRSVG
jgi:folate-binding protein YgfZ